MITKDKIFFLNQLVDSMDKAAEKLQQATTEKNKKELAEFILSVQDEIKNLILVIK